MYVLQLMDRRGTYVAKPGSLKSYTTNLRRARRFATAEEAAQNACGNEAVVRLSHVPED